MLSSRPPVLKKINKFVRSPYAFRLTVSGMKRLLYVALAGALSTVLWSGCGSTSTSDGLGTQNQNPGTNAFYHGFVLGRVKLLPELQAGPVEVLSSSGEVLRQATADVHGFFYYEGVLPPDFRLRAIRGGDIFESEYRGGWSGGTLYINAGTTLAAAYHRAHPEQTLAQSEATVRRFYRLPADFPMSWVSTVRTIGFNTEDFFRQVRGAGSLEAYTNVFLQNGLTTQPPLANQTGQTLLETAYRGIFTDTTNNAGGNSYFRIDQNTSSEDAVTDIQNRLTIVNSGVSQLFQGLIYPSSLSEAIRWSAGANAEISDIVETLARFKSIKGGTNYNVPDTYGAPNSDLRGFDISPYVTAIGGPIYDTGTNGAYQSLARLQMNRFKLVDASLYGSYPWRFNDATLGQQELFAVLAAGLEEAAYMEAEGAMLVGAGQMAARLTNLPNQLNDIAYNNQLAIQQVPDLLGVDEVVVDAPHGTMWWRVVVGNLNEDQAKSFIRNLELGPYDDWDLPSQTTLDTLVKKRTGPVTADPAIDTSGTTWADVAYGDWSAAFAAMLFDTSAYATEVNAFFSGGLSDSDNEGAWCYTDDRSNVRLYEWNGTGSNPSTSLPTSDITTNLLCSRPFAGPTDDYAYIPPALSSQAVFVPPAPETGLYVPSPMQCTILKGNPTVSAGTATSYGTQLQAKGDFVGPNGSGFGSNLDCTRRVGWSSSNTAVATVSNYVSSSTDDTPGPAGFVTWHPPLDGSALSPVEITAKLFTFTNDRGSIGSEYRTGTLRVTPPADCVPVLSKSMLVPNNQTYTVLIAPQFIAIHMLVYYKDGRVVDVSQDSGTTWTLTTSDGTVLNSPSTAGFGVTPGSSKNEIFVTSNVPDRNLKYTATYQGRWGTQTASGQMIVNTPR